MTPGEETCGGRGSEWLTPRRRGINSSLKEKKIHTYIICIYIDNYMMRICRSKLVLRFKQRAPVSMARNPERSLLLLCRLYETQELVKSQATPLPVHVFRFQ